MTDPENFLTRWSRRKRDVAEEAGEQQDPADAQSAEQGADAGREAQQVPAGEAAEPPFDLAKLPAIESITADTDIRGFFAPGVPAELRLAALRRAWVADPKIRDFVGLADYDFDFHTPGAIPGFGPLEMTDALRREVRRIVGDLLPEDEPAAATASAGEPEPVAAPAQPSEETTEINPEASPEAAAAPANLYSLPVESADLAEDTPPRLVGVRRDKEIAALRQDYADAENLQIPARRSHGGALPK